MHTVLGKWEERGMMLEEAAEEMETERENNTTTIKMCEKRQQGGEGRRGGAPWRGPSYWYNQLGNNNTSEWIRKPHLM